MAQRERIYFISDIHLGMSPKEDSSQREKLLVEWLESIRKDARELWLLGDTFDYWFEYRKVVPRGFVRFLGKLAQLSDEGVEIHIFTGNHDVWIFGYLPAEIGVTVHRESLLKQWNDHTFLLGHGDGLLPSDRSYRLLQRVFKSRGIQWLYTRIHPNGSTAFAQWWSKLSRNKKDAQVPFLGPDKEHQLIYAREKLAREPGISYFIFGHRHIPFDIKISPDSRVICLGDWINNFTYAVYDGREVLLKQHLPDRGDIITLDSLN